MTAFTGLFVQAPKADPPALFRKALGEGWPMIDGNREPPRGVVMANLAGSRAWAAGMNGLRPWETSLKRQERR